MNPTEPVERFGQRPLRLWPGVVALLLQGLLWFGLPLVTPDSAPISIIGGAALGTVIFLWWAFFSRAPHLERFGGLVLTILAGLAAFQILDPSIQGGHMGLTYPIYVIPLFSVALVGAAVIGRNLATGPRRAVLAVAIVAAAFALCFVRTEGITGEGESQFAWRWSPTKEELLVARAPAPAARTADAAPAKPESTPPAAERPRDPVKPAATKPIPEKPEAAASRAPWPGFRGPDRDGRVAGVRIDTDWSAHPPEELWRRPIGPGWSSFAVGDGLLYTQEQRGENEVVSSYRLASGEPVWVHSDAVRFYESNAGPGPRGTPALHGGRVYSLGATGILNALDAASGALVWTKNAVADTGAKIPPWGITSSPLVVGDVVVVAASGRLAAYEIATGKLRWTQATGGGSYSSPHLMTLAGMPQILLLNGAGAYSVAPQDGKVLWTHAWAGTPMLQPAAAGDGSVLIMTGDAQGGMGTRRLSISHAGDWKVEETWISRGLKPYFNDLVVHKGHAYGFDGAILSCIDLQDGSRKWKGGRFGHGQMILLPDQDLLLVLSEQGEIALVAASPESFQEIARRPAIEGKTWNHPVLVGDVLLVRNGEQMAAFRLARPRT